MRGPFVVKYACRNCGRKVELDVIEDKPDCPACGGELKVKKVSKLKK